MKKIILIITAAVLLMLSVSVYAEDADFSDMNFDKTFYVSENGKYYGKGRTPDDAFLSMNKAFDEIVKHSGTYKIVIDGSVEVLKTCGLDMARSKIYITGSGLIEIGKSFTDLTAKKNLRQNERPEPKVTFFIPQDCEMIFGGENCKITNGISIKNNGVCTVNDGVKVGYISNMGTLNLNGGSAVSENVSSIEHILSNSGKININGFVYSGADTFRSLIYNGPNGTINMNDGEISGCDMGVENHGEFNLNGGRIFNCGQYAVKNYKTFNRSENTICNGKVYDVDANDKSTLVSDENNPLEQLETTTEPIVESTTEPIIEPTATPTLEPAEENEIIPVYINNEKVHFTDTFPFIDESNRTQAPVRAIGEALGCKVGYSTENGGQVITLIKDDNTVTMEIGSPDINVNGTVTTMDTSAIIVNDRTYIPVRYIGESLGYKVSWVNGCVFIDE